MGPEEVEAALWGKKIRYWATNGSRIDAFQSSEPCARHASGVYVYKTHTGNMIFEGTPGYSDPVELSPEAYKNLKWL